MMEAGVGGIAGGGVGVVAAIHLVMKLGGGANGV